MYIYNVTVNVEEDIHDQWLQWMRTTHIPEMIATGKFTHAKMLKVLVEEETGGITYSIQYVTDSKGTLEKYYAEDASRLRQDGMSRFADKFVAFRTELEVIGEF
ncbi:MAG: DUF4286 family protein [Bacteroidota bacterium]